MCLPFLKQFLVSLRSRMAINIVSLYFFFSPKKTSKCTPAAPQKKKGKESKKTKKRERKREKGNETFKWVTSCCISRGRDGEINR